MKFSPVLFGLAAIACSSLAAEIIGYDQLLASSQNGANAKAALGKRILVAASGKGDLGYFIHKGDHLTFACDSGDKALASYKVSKGLFQGTVVKSTWWEGTTVWSLKDCQWAAPAVAVTAPLVAKGTP